MSAESLAYTVETAKDFDTALAAVQTAAEEARFRVLAVHDIGATLAAQGLAREPVAIVEVCNARYASAVLAEDIAAVSLLPCKINVYREDGKTYLSAPRPQALAALLPGAGLSAVAQEVDGHIRAILENAR